MKRNSAALVTIAGLAAIICSPSRASAQSVGAAQSFAVLGGSTVTAAGTGSTINGDVGVSPGTSITGFPFAATIVSPYGLHVNDGAAINAQTATTALYTSLAGTGGATSVGPELGGLTLIPGTYSISGAANIASGLTLTLSGGGTYIFKVGSAITANVGSNVVMSGGGSPCSVFWQVTSAATLNGVNFAGTVVAQSGITLGVGSTLNGRALTTTPGSVTMAGSGVVGGCSGAPVPTTPTVFIVLLAFGLAGLGYARLRGRARA
jgi:hypothetical protein